jgi:hypothetical protein
MKNFIYISALLFAAQGMLHAGIINKSITLDNKTKYNSFQLSWVNRDGITVPDGKEIKAGTLLKIDTGTDCHQKVILSIFNPSTGRPQSKAFIFEYKDLINQCKDKKIRIYDDSTDPKNPKFLDPVIISNVEGTVTMVGDPRYNEKPLQKDKAVYFPK